MHRNKRGLKRRSGGTFLPLPSLPQQPPQQPSGAALHRLPPVATASSAPTWVTPRRSMRPAASMRPWGALGSAASIRSRGELGSRLLCAAYPEHLQPPLRQAAPVGWLPQAEHLCSLDPPGRKHDARTAECDRQGAPTPPMPLVRPAGAPVAGTYISGPLGVDEK